MEPATLDCQWLGCRKPALFLNVYRLGWSTNIVGHRVCEEHTIIGAEYDDYQNDMYYALHHPGDNPALDDCIFMWLDALHTYKDRLLQLQAEVRLGFA